MAKPEKHEKHVASPHIQMREKIVAAALTLAAQMGWDMVTLGDIADECDLSLAQLHEHVEDKADVLAALGRMIDARVLAQTQAPDNEASPKERLFDVFMDRYEIINDHREGVCAIIASFRYEPGQALISLPHLCRSMSWMMEAAGLSVRGYKGALALAGLSALYIKVLNVWREDESPDLSKTMAALDKELDRAERLADMLGF